jgi:hypothetical protein
MYLGNIENLRNFASNTKISPPQPTNANPQSAYASPQSPNMNPQSKNMNPLSKNMNPQSKTMNPQSKTMNPQSKNMNPQCTNMNPQSTNMNPQWQKNQVWCLVSGVIQQTVENHNENTNGKLNVNVSCYRKQENLKNTRLGLLISL